jgi:hypothetical protein
MATDTYSDTHRLLAQYFISHQVVREDELIAAFPDVNLPAAIAAVNQQLQCMYLDIKGIVYDEDGQLYYGIVNSKNDVLAQKATSFTPHEIELFKAIVCDSIRENKSKRNTLPTDMDTKHTHTPMNTAR